MERRDFIGKQLEPVLFAGVVGSYPLSSVYTRTIYGDPVQHFLVFNNQWYRNPKRREKGPQIVAVINVGSPRAHVKDTLTPAEERRVKEFIYQCGVDDPFWREPENWSYNTAWIENNFSVCYECMRIVSNMNVHDVDGVSVCNHCLRDDRKYLYCSSCGSYHKKENMRDFMVVDYTGQKIQKRTCKTCYDLFLGNYIVCDDCGALVPKVCVINEGGRSLCINCSRDFSLCGYCGNIHHVHDLTEKDGKKICVTCEARMKERTTPRKCGERETLFSDNDHILSYHYNETFWERRFYCSKGYTLEPLNLAGPYLGVEYEIEGNNYDDTREYIENVLGFACGLGHFENDSSLEYGAEFVMEPMTLAYARRSPEITGLLMEAESYMIDSYNAGMHIHVARDYFGDRENQIKSFGVLAYWLDRFSDDFYRISRRPERDGSYYGRRSFSLFPDTTKSELEEKIERYDDGERYKNLNLNNSKTIEFRFFGSTLDHYEFIKTLEVIDTISRKAKHYTVARACLVSDFSELLDRSDFKGGM